MGIDDFLEDSLTYSPLKEIQNKENSPALFFKTLDRAKQSPSTAKLFSLLGGGNLDFRSCAGSPVGSKPVARRLEDLLNTPERSPPESSTDLASKSVNAAEMASLRASLATIQQDCDFHRKRATHAQDELDGLTKYVAILEEERRTSRKSTPFVDSDDENRRLSVLNTSLARQNDLLRGRSSVTSRFHKKDSSVQTPHVPRIDVGTITMEEHCSPIMSRSPVFSPRHISFMGTPSYIGAPGRKDSGSQTVSGVWATVEQMDYNSRPSLPIKNKRSSSVRKSQPPPEYTFLSRNDWRPLAAVKKRGKSVGPATRPKWIP